MIRIDNDAWREMVAHSMSAYPGMACGVMLGFIDGPVKLVTGIKPAINLSSEVQIKWEISLEQIEQCEKHAARLGLEIIGLYHSNPDCDAYFSKADLENANPWLSYVILSLKRGQFDHANSYLPNNDHEAVKEELIYQT